MNRAGDIREVLATLPDDYIAQPLATGTRVGHVRLHVADLDAAVRFYRDQIGYIPFTYAQGMASQTSTSEEGSRSASPSTSGKASARRGDRQAWRGWIASRCASIRRSQAHLRPPGRVSRRRMDLDSARRAGTFGAKEAVVDFATENGHHRHAELATQKEMIEIMRAITLDNFGASPGLREDLPTPQIAPNEVLVRVHASSVNPVDNSIASGMLKDMVEHEFPIVLGRDFAGVVEQVGSDVSGLSEGDEVFGFVPGMSPAVHDGSWAELIAVPESIANRKPEGVDTASAGAAPLAAITAMSALDALGVSEGDTILVVGANGGVGSFAVQLAANAGATVIAPGLPEDEQYLKDLGVSEILPRDADIATLVHERYPEGIEALLDLVSYAPEGFDTHAEVLKDDGRGASPLSAAGEGSERHNVMAVPAPEHLQRLARLLEAGTLRVPIQQTYELDLAGEALRALSAEHTQGKRAIHVS